MIFPTIVFFLLAVYLAVEISKEHQQNKDKDEKIKLLIKNSESAANTIYKNTDRLNTGNVSHSKANLITCANLLKQTIEICTKK